MEYQKYLNEIVNLTKNLGKDLLIFAKGKKKISSGVFFGKSVVVEPNVFFDASAGMIAIGEGTKIKANAILRGPLIIGKNCVINSFAEISDSRIGDVCKIGGEIKRSIIKDYTNKAHHGFLGDSYVGSWVNIGAGASVSNLKNTYSTIKVGGIDTGLDHCGVIIGDYVKIAINTSIFCGKIIGPGAHLYGTVTEDVPAFTSHVRPGNFYEIPLDVSIKIQKAMSTRRDMKFTTADQKHFEKLFKETVPERKAAKAKKGKLSFK